VLSLIVDVTFVSCWLSFWLMSCAAFWFVMLVRMCCPWQLFLVVVLGCVGLSLCHVVGLSLLLHHWCICV